ncbi:MAG: hypothetical protein WCT12_06270 [Verrucomicrobiota bacterium]
MDAKLHNLETADARSVRLWPDPLVAPDVPSGEWLDRWWAGEGDADLNAQMAASPNCRRAAEALRQESFSQALGGQAVETAPVPPPPEPARPDAAPRAVGALVETRADIQLFDADRAIQPVWRLGFPPTAFLVEGPFETGFDRVWRAMFAAPRFIFPDDGPGEEADGPARKDCLARLMEGAGWLTAVADARQQAAEWEAEIGEALAEAGTEDMFALRSPANAMAFARGPEVVTPAFLIRLREGETSREVLARPQRLEEMGTPLVAALKQRPADLGEGTVSAIWKLTYPLPPGVAGCLVAVVNRETRQVLGTARPDSHGVVRWETSPERLTNLQVDQLALIIISRA